MLMRYQGITMYDRRVPHKRRRQAKKGAVRGIRRPSATDESLRIRRAGPPDACDNASVLPKVWRETGDAMNTSFITINTHSSIRLQTQNGTVVYVDPYGFTAEPHDADLILVTHSHFDHLSPEDIARVRRPSTVFVLPVSCKRDFAKAGFSHEEATFLVPYEHTTPLPDIEVEAMPAYNVSKGFHPKQNGWLGYVIATDGTRVYVAGDTDDLPENRSIACDIALVPAGGTYTMDAREAAAFVNALRPTVAIPEHYGTVAGSPEDGETFASLVNPNIEVVLKL